MLGRKNEVDSQKSRSVEKSLKLAKTVEKEML